MNVRCYALEAKYEFLKHLRMPSYAIPSIIFPVMFYLLFGVMFGGARPTAGTTVGTYMMATYSTFGVIGAALFGFGVGIAVERGQGWMTLKRATPMPPMAYFVAKVAMAVLFGTIIISLISVTGVILAGVRLSAGQWLALSATLIAGAVPLLLPPTVQELHCSRPPISLPHSRPGRWQSEVAVSGDAPFVE
jgi:ABC-2 type transport system permease protein